METKLEKIDLQMNEIAYHILNLGEVILNLLEVDIKEETLWRIDSLSKAISKNCEELTEQCNEGYEILAQLEVQKLKQEEYKFTNEQLQMIIQTHEDLIKTQNDLIESFRERDRTLKEIKADAVLAEA